MATYRVTDPTTGRTVKLTGDAPPTEQELNEVFSAIGNTPVPQKERSLAGKTWDALAVPEQMANKAMQKLTPFDPTRFIPGREPTGNLPLDLIANTPKILGETAADVKAKLLPSYVSRESILTAGALKGIQVAKPLIKGTGAAIARGAEALSGLEHKTPGVLVEAAKDSSLIKAGGKKAAQLIYESDKKMGGAVSTELKQIPAKMEFVQKAKEFADKGQLSPIEALEARKELDSIKKSVTGEFFRNTRESLDSVAKKAFEKGDAAYQRAVKAEALRSLLPLNKTGGSSTFKTMLGGVTGILPLGVMSPAVQGATATGAGMVARAAAPLVNSPATGAAVTAIVKTLTKDDVKKLVKEAPGETLEEKKANARKIASEKGWTWPGKK